MVNLVNYHIMPKSSEVGCPNLSRYFSDACLVASFWPTPSFWRAFKWINSVTEVYQKCIIWTKTAEVDSRNSHFFRKSGKELLKALQSFISKMAALSWLKLFLKCQFKKLFWEFTNISPTNGWNLCNHKKRKYYCPSIIHFEFFVWNIIFIIYTCSKITWS